MTFKELRVLSKKKELSIIGYIIISYLNEQENYSLSLSNKTFYATVGITPDLLIKHAALLKKKGLIEYSNKSTMRLLNPDSSTALNTVSVILPWDSDEFREIWNEWKTFRKEAHSFSYLPRTEQNTLKNLHLWVGGNEELAIQVILITIDRKWKGLEYGLKVLKEQNDTFNSKTSSTVKSWDDEFGEN